MTKIFKITVLLIILVLLVSPAQGSAQFQGEQPEPVVRVAMFWMESCGNCYYIMNSVFPSLQDQYGGALEINLIEVVTMQDVDRVYQLASDYGLPAGGTGVPLLIIGEHALVGDMEIEQKLPGLIDASLESGGVDLPVSLGGTAAESGQFGSNIDQENQSHPEEKNLPDPNVVNVYFFWGDGCPYCEAQKPFMDELQSRYANLNIRSYEIYYIEENVRLFLDVAAAAGFEARSVPTTIIGGRYWVGYSDDMKQQLEAAAVACLESGCLDPGAGIAGTGIPAGWIGGGSFGSGPVELAAPPEEPNILALPLIGVINLDAQSLAFSTAIIAFVDGFNPCSLWVLSILLALVIHSGSRRKTLLVGLTFLLVTAGIYSLFIAGLFKVFTIVSFMGWVQITVALLALGFALVNIKDYFWYKEGLSFTISDKHKPKIYRDFRAVLTGNKSIVALISATVVMALGIALVELPCTAGFPVLWSKMVSTQQVSSLSFGLLLGLYMLIYLLDELLIFGTAVVTLRASRLEEKQGRVLKLIGGVVMLSLALVLLINPDLMNSFNSTLLVFTAAFAGTGLVLLVHRVVLPRFGIVIGTEGKKKKVKARRRQTAND
jgi:thiol-disulfide isomerase/thioredoxin